MSKKTLYRCPRCDSVIERYPEVDELMQLVPEKGKYQCGICGHFMPASEVLSGRHDIKNPESEVPAASETQLPTLSDVLAKLKVEHINGYVYRGQPKEWPGPLLSSVYRGMVNSRPLHSWDPNIRLR